ncbi:MAG TPA: hypothetical protein VLE89_08730 [Chlamydiales bacterium]|nr:hypothetical protein [Chlamydiales bacterium]
MTIQSSPSQLVADYTSSWIGILRTTQATQELCRIANEGRRLANKAPLDNLSKACSALDGGVSALMLCGIPSAAKTAVESISDLNKRKDHPGSGQRAIKAFHDVSDVASMCSYTGVLFSRLPIFKTLAALFDVTTDGTEIQMYGRKYLRSKHLQKKADLEDVKGIKHEKTFNLLKLMRAVAATFAGVLGLIAIATGMALLPTLAFAIVSLAAVALDMTSHFYKASHPKQLVDHSVVPLTG